MSGVMTVELSEVEHVALTELLREVIGTTRYPFSPRIKTLSAVLAKLEPPAPAVEPYPAPTPSARPSLALSKKRRR